MDSQEHDMVVLGQIVKPNFAIVNRAKDSDPKMAWTLCATIRPGEIVIFDKAYVDFEHLHHLHQRGITWVICALKLLLKSRNMKRLFRLIYLQSQFDFGDV